MSNEFKSQVLAAIPVGENNAASGTAISKAVGFAKSNARVTAAIDELIKDEAIRSKTHDRGYLMYYKLVKDKAKATTESAGIEKAATTAKATPAVTVKSKEKAEFKNVGDCKLPSKAYNYTITPGDAGEVIVTTPEKTQVVLTGNQRMLVINQNSNYRYVIEHPEDIFIAIDEYTRDQRIASFLVTDMETNVAFNKKDLESGKKDMDIIILFISISRHNKAGR